MTHDKYGAPIKINGTAKERREFIAKMARLERLERERLDELIYQLLVDAPKIRYVGRSQ